MPHVSATPATEWLKRHQVSFTEHVYDYVEHGGTAESSRQLGVDEHHVVKTLVMQDDQHKGLVVLMHGNCKVSTKNLARQIGVNPFSFTPLRPQIGFAHASAMDTRKGLGVAPFGVPPYNAHERNAVPSSVVLPSA